MVKAKKAKNPLSRRMRPPMQTWWLECLDCGAIFTLGKKIDLNDLELTCPDCGTYLILLGGILDKKNYYLTYDDSTLVKPKKWKIKQKGKLKQKLGDSYSAHSIRFRERSSRLTR